MLTRRSLIGTLTSACLFPLARSRKAYRGPVRKVKTIKDGYWHDPTVWSTGEVPGERDSVLVLHMIMLTGPVADLAVVFGHPHPEYRIYEEANGEIHALHATGNYVEGGWRERGAGKDKMGKMNNT